MNRQIHIFFQSSFIPVLQCRSLYVFLYVLCTYAHTNPSYAHIGASETFRNLLQRHKLGSKVDHANSTQRDSQLFQTTQIAGCIWPNANLPLSICSFIRYEQDSKHVANHSRTPIHIHVPIENHACHDARVYHIYIYIYVYRYVHQPTLVSQKPIEIETFRFKEGYVTKLPSLLCYQSIPARVPQACHAEPPVPSTSGHADHRH